MLIKTKKQTPSFVDKQEMNGGKYYCPLEVLNNRRRGGILHREKLRFENSFLFSILYLPRALIKIVVVVKS